MSTILEYIIMFIWSTAIFMAVGLMIRLRLKKVENGFVVINNHKQNNVRRSGRKSI